MWLVNEGQVGVASERWARQAGVYADDLLFC